MKNKIKNETEAQGAEVSKEHVIADVTAYAETAIAAKINDVVEEKKRGGNILYTIRQFTTMINKMRDQELIDGVQHETLKQMAKQITAKYIGLDMF